MAKHKIDPLTGETPGEKYSRDQREKAVAKFLDFIQKGPGEWKKGHTGEGLGRPVNLQTGVPYTGANTILLGMLSPFASNQWIAQGQLEAWAESLRKGGTPEDKLPRIAENAVPTMGCFVFEANAEYGAKKGAGAKPSDGAESNATAAPGNDEADEDRKVADKSTKRVPGRSQMSWFKAYNAEQIVNCPAGIKGMERNFEPVAAGELVTEAMKEKTGLKVVHGSGNFYDPATDSVHLAPKDAFKSEYDYYSTAGHEYIHATLSATRMDRREALGKRWGDEAYAMEELRAGIGSMFLSMEMGLDPTDEQVRNHAAYVASWRKVLASDGSELFKAMADAEKCVGYIVGKTNEYAKENGIDIRIGPPSKTEAESMKSAAKKAAKDFADKGAASATAAVDVASKPKRRSAGSGLAM